MDTEQEQLSEGGRPVTPRYGTLGESDGATPGRPPNAAPVADAHLIERVRDRAHALTVSALRKHGNQLSRRHEEALREASGLFTDTAAGGTKGLFVLDLPTGLGKTASVVAWAKAMVEAGAPWSLAICASRVEELCSIHADLTSGEAAVPRDCVALWHAKRDAPVPATFGPYEAHRYAERPILLLTHQRVRQGPTIERRLLSGENPRDLVVYDESLATTELRHASYTTLVGQLKQVSAGLSSRQGIAALAERLMTLLDDEVTRQTGGSPPHPILLSIADEPTHLALKDAVQRQLGPDSELEQLIEHGPHPARIIVLGEERKDATVIRYDVAVPDRLDQMIVLDASYGIRRLLPLAAENLAPHARSLRLIPGSNLRPALGEPLKRYDHLTVHLMQTRGSGREFVAGDLRRGLDGSAVLAETVAIVRNVPTYEAVLVWTFLQSSDNLPNFGGYLQEALGREGIDTGAKVIVDGEPRDRIVVETFGRETASNAHKHCTNVIFMGCLEPARQQIAGAFVAETRELLTEVSPALVDDLVRGEVYHRVYQAISRAACRDVFVDDDGQTQAKPTKVWLMSRHGTIRGDLEAAFPGARWCHWVATVEGDLLQTKLHWAAAAISAFLDTCGRPRIGLKTIEAAVEVEVGSVTKDTFQAARDRAIEDTGWRLEGQSLVRTGE